MPQKLMLGRALTFSLFGDKKLMMRSIIIFRLNDLILYKIYLQNCQGPVYTYEGNFS